MKKLSMLLLTIMAIILFSPNITSYAQSPLQGYLFIGDSHTARLRDYGFANQYGFEVEATGGYTTSMIYYQSFAYAPHNPTAIVIMGGINDLGLNTWDGTANNMSMLVDNLQLLYPNVPIYIQKILPTSYDIMANRFQGCELSRVNSYNALLRSMCQNKTNVKLIDTSGGFIDSNGYMNPITSDEGVHIKLEYYPQWIDNIISQCGGKVNGNNKTISTNSTNLSNTNRSVNTYILSDYGLEKGEVGESVKWLQYELGIKEDGKFGKNTEKYVRQFQAKWGLPQTGIADITTLCYLLTY